MTTPQPAKRSDLIDGRCKGRAGALKEQDGILDPEHIAEAYWYLHTQPRDARTFELDLRPWIEPW